MQKNDALDIRKDFRKIFIDDPRSRPRIDKYQIFTKILSDSKLDKKSIWVIGDNPDSEIRAAHDLGIPTIQRSSNSKTESNLANYYIENFNELKDILS